MEKRKRGGQSGNQNARKHGFYSTALGKDRRSDFRRAKKVIGIDDEIALLRMEIKSLIEKDTPDRRLIAQDIKILASLESARLDMRKKNGGDMLDAVRNYYETNDLMKWFRGKMQSQASPDRDIPKERALILSPQAEGPS